MSDVLQRKYSIGAEVINNGVDFRVWAPKQESLHLILDKNQDNPLTMQRLENGYFGYFAQGAKANSLYQFRCEDDQSLYPDPASRFQPYGPSGPSQVVDPTSYCWSEHNWHGLDGKGRIIYEMHIGTFTQEGTWKAAEKELKELSRIGINVIEMMPIAEFPGEFGWGYDGVNLFAPMHIYGTPDELRSFIDAAHQCGIGVILDVVYNHFGPDQNYLNHFSDHYFSQKHKTDWGNAINFDDVDSQFVREFFIINAAYWIEEFHFDGLRIDASQNIYDESPTHILNEITQTARKAGQNRSVYIIAENEPQHSILVRPIDKGGNGLDALWNDDFHHSAMVRMTGRNEAYYSDHKGLAQEFLSAIKYGFLYQGQWYSWQEKKRGTPSLDLEPCQFINFIQNHDQIANSAHGKRAHQITDPSTYRTMTALLLLAPQTPMLFQGQEFAATNPFHYFADHKEELAKKVNKGRLEFFKQFPSIMTPEIRSALPKPTDNLTFLKCKLDFNERATNEAYYLLHSDLLALRKNDPVFNQSLCSKLDGAIINPDAFIIRYFGQDDERLVIVNFGIDFDFSPTPEPLTAPPENCYWDLLWSSEDSKYDGSGFLRLTTKGNWHIQGRSLMILSSHLIEKT